MALSNRAYSLLNIKSFDDTQRVFEGIASTPSIDRMGDSISPLGARFALPMPLLLDHNSKQAVGHVEFAKPNKDGIPFKARIATIAEPGSVKDLVDGAWTLVKNRLRSFVSIGFRPIDYEVMKDGGYNFKEWEWLELSLVSVPAQKDAVVFDGKELDKAFHAVKSIDTELLAASGRSQEVSPSNPAGGTAPTKSTSKVKARPMAKKTIAEQIAAFEATRAAKSARMGDLMDEASEKGETLDGEQSEEYDGLSDELKALDSHLVRLRDHEKVNRAAAVVVEGGDEDAGTKARAATVPAQAVRAKLELPKGTGFTRYVIALCRARGNIMQAHEIAKGNDRWRAETPEVETILRTAVSAGTTSDSTWAGPLVVYQNLANEFVNYLDPLTIIGRIPGLRRVPFKVKIPRETGTATVNWVGEGKVKPLTSLAFDTVTVEFAKIAGIIPLTEELVRFSNPAAETLVRDRLAASITAFMDRAFVDPTAASSDVNPASITYGVSAITATGTTASALRADVKTLMASFLSNNLNPADCVWIMTQQQALAIAMMVNTLGQPEWPGISMNGGTFVGLPVIASENIPGTGGSPTDGGLIILAKASDILLADDGQVTIDASREASLQMDTAPDSPSTASTTMVSMFQQNMIAIKAERFIAWQKARSTCVGLLQYCKYAE